MERTNRWLWSAAATALLAGNGLAADNAGRMLGNAERAAGLFQSGLGAGVTPEDTAARGFEGQQALLGFGAGAGGDGAVDATGRTAPSGFARFQERHAAGRTGAGYVPSPIAGHRWDPSERGGSYGGDGGDRGRRIGEIVGRVAGLALGVIAMMSAVPLAFSGNIVGVAIAAAVIAGTWQGRPQGESLIERIASSPLSNGLGKLGGFVGHWTDRGIEKVKGLFRR
ncbi:MAG: hypothetical protein HY553_03575 [Elusimicrobia bacterium]|nr:hypothetical protein [Elusimicrobiota bacterium]